jgi:phage terminase large subunit
MTTSPIRIEYVKNLYPIFTKPKRIKIIVGGRGSTKSTGIADYVACKVATDELWCCAREHQNSIEESVHRTILDEIDRLGLRGFEDTKTSIHHASGGRTFYRGLARNITSLKSTLSGVDGLWIEEGEDITENTLRVLTASVRLNATDTERLIAGEDVKMPEIIITMNRGSRTGAIAQKWLARAETELARNGYYEDDVVMVVQMNYTDMPREWFLASGLEEERRDDMEKLSRAEYDHKWHGAYLDEVEGSIIKPEWFDACLNAHKHPKLERMFKPLGPRIAVHDPFDDGNDAGGYCLRHGSIIEIVRSKNRGEVDITCEWALDNAMEDGADWFIWDGDGMGAGLKGQVKAALEGTRMQYHMFRGSLAGMAQDRAGDVYEKGGTENEGVESKMKPKTYAATFKNNRAQYYMRLATRMYNTYRCLERNEYVDVDEMLSINSDGVENVNVLRSQICRVPRKANGNGLIQIMSKDEMKRLGIPSPNEGDCLMMSMFTPTDRPKEEEWFPKTQTSWMG